MAARYRVLNLIGTGGMGAVYRAEHVHMRKTVALKLLHPELLRVGEVVQRFEREAIAAARIDHPNVVAASDFGKLDDGSFYLVLEYVDGTSLRQLLERGPLPAARALNIARQTVLALGAAHAAGIVHRDLKPDNVMLVPGPDGSDRVKVLDFGIARVAPPSENRDATKLTRVGVVMGTVAYMSPEQATGQAIDERTDLYSLGVMIYEMIAGVVPFDAELPSQVLARQLVEAPPPLPEGTAPALAELVYDLMEKKADDRPPNAQAVLDRLVALTPTPSGRVLPLKKPIPRALVLGVGAGALLLGILLALLGRSHADVAAPSADPEASGSTSVAATASAAPAPPPAAPPPVVAATTSAPTASVTSESAEKSAGKSASPKANKSAAKAKSASAPAQTTSRPAPPPPPPPPAKHKTGPGGIYIPPPSEWFKN
ncbi:MAG TPA: serine/threonine-protein kinase [Polyangiaceae bacterium]|nr:serine/threonine-protein kinase [Polyangiaceae bacterium]